MSGAAQVTSRHRDRLAVIYVRQSTLAQVRENTESTNRQYGLAEKACAARKLGAISRPVAWNQSRYSGF